MAKMTYEKLVAECKRLRGLHERAEAEFFAFLVSAETDHAEIWKEAGCSDFEQFLRSNHLADTDRYRFFAIGLSRVGVQEAVTNGAPWTIQRGKLDQAPPKAIEEFTARARAFVETEGVAPSDQAVREWRSQAVAGHDKHATIRRVDELSRLREENAKLKAELSAARRRIAELEGRVPAPAKKPKTESRPHA